MPSTAGFRCGCPTSDHAPVLHWAGHDTRLQGRRLSGFSPLQYLLWTERLVPSWRNCTQRTVRIWKPRLPQDLGQCSHSSVIHLDQQESEEITENEAIRSEIITIIIDFRWETSHWSSFYCKTFQVLQMSLDSRLHRNALPCRLSQLCLISIFQPTLASPFVFNSVISGDIYMLT